MKGLLLKDLYAMKKTLRMYGVMLGFYSIYSVTRGDIAFLCGMVAILCAMAPITILASDENSKWDSFALALPLQRRDIVASKYLLGLAISVVAQAVAVFIGLVMCLFGSDQGVAYVLAAALGCGTMGIFLMSFILPIIYKLGVEKGRLAYMACMLVPMLLLPLLSGLSVAAVNAVLWAVPVAVVAAPIISFRISLAIYSAKDF